MRWLVVLVGFTAGCSIPRDHFIGPGGLDDAGGDGRNDGRGVDASTTTAMQKGWVVDGSGLHRVTKDPATGALQLVPTGYTSINNAQSAIANRQGTHLFVAIQSGAAPSVADYAIAADGTLAFQGSVSPGCSPKYMAVHPTANFLAVGCTVPSVSILTLTSAGGIDPAATAKLRPAGLASPGNVIFSTDGTCLIAADVGATAAAVNSFNFDTQAGQLGNPNSADGPNAANGLAVHPNGQTVYVSGSTAVWTYAVTGACGLSVVEMHPTAPNGGAPSHAVVTPTGSRVAATSIGVYTFDVAADGKLTTSTGSPSFPGSTPVAAIMDPAMPNIVYVTTPSSTYPASFNADGSLTMGASVSTGAANTVWFAMAP